MVPRVPPGGELRDRHSYVFAHTRLGSQSLLKVLAQHRAPPGGPRPPFLLVLTLMHSVFSSTQELPERVLCVLGELSGVSNFPVPPTHLREN